MSNTVDFEALRFLSDVEAAFKASTGDKEFGAQVATILNGLRYNQTQREHCQCGHPRSEHTFHQGAPFGPHVGLVLTLCGVECKCGQFRPLQTKEPS